MSKRVIDVLAAFDAAGTAREYRAAKRLAAKFEPVAQLAMVDTMRAACIRLRNAGVI